MATTGGQGRARRLPAALRAAAAEEYAARREIATALLRAGTLRESAWWSSGIRRAKREALLSEADDIVAQLARRARRDEELVLTVAQDALLTVGYDMGNIESFEIVAGDQSRLEERRRHSGALLVMAINEIDEDMYPGDIIVRGVETPAEVAAASTMYRWWARRHPRSEPPRAQLRREFLNATADVLAVWSDRDVVTETMEELIDALLAPEGYYLEKLKGGSYPGFE